jgi:hypothetical protein
LVLSTLAPFLDTLTLDLGDIVATTQCNATPFIPIVKATVTAAEQSHIGKAIKDGIDKFSEGMPILMSALDEVKALHPFIGGELIH